MSGGVVLDIKSSTQPASQPASRDPWSVIEKSGDITVRIVDSSSNSSSSSSDDTGAGAGAGAGADASVGVGAGGGSLVAGRRPYRTH
ncbi:hypothetical protein HZH68_000140 [Vespula germanica]|uniref:Uncharacterized protein n=1 Tax=Vespula germanica TaxID=30212 RepID=A0A834NT05_VESGE|nr:hypothetical protein HZH68_000140 [Vespula germanica]